MNQASRAAHNEECDTYDYSSTLRWQCSCSFNGLFKKKNIFEVVGMDTVKPNGLKQRRLTHSIIDSMRTTLEHVSVCLIRSVEHHMLFRVARDINNNNTVRVSSACMMKHLSNAIVESMLP